MLAKIADEIPQSDGFLFFDALQQRLHPAASRVARLAQETPASFVAFDLLAGGGRSTMALPQAERRLRLERLPGSVTQPLHLTPMTRWRRACRARKAAGARAKTRRGSRCGPSASARSGTATCRTGRFRQAAVFLCWRPDRPPQDCRYDQLEVTTNVTYGVTGVLRRNPLRCERSSVGSMARHVRRGNGRLGRRATTAPPPSCVRPVRSRSARRCRGRSARGRSPRRRFRCPGPGRISATGPAAALRRTRCSAAP